MLNKIKEIIPRHFAVFAIVGLCFILVRIYYIDFIPLFDGFSYVQHMLMAVSQPFNPLNFDGFAGHNSWLYLLLLGIPQYFSLGNIYLINAATLVMGLLGIYFFFGILKIYFRPLNKKKIRKYELLLVLTLFGVHPIFLSNSINVSTDFGVLVFYLGLLYGLLKRNHAITLATSLVLIFTKELGLLLYIVTTTLFLLFFVLRRNKKIRIKLRALWRYAYLCIPYCAFGAYYITKVLWQKKGLFFEGSGHEFSFGSLLEIFLSFNLFDMQFISSLVNIFIFNFNWLLTLFLVLLILLQVGKWVINFDTGQCDRRAFHFQFLWILFWVNLYLVTRYPNGANIRYFLPVYPLLIILYFRSLETVLPNKYARMTVLVITTGFVLAANVTSRDPLTARIFGTFQFGKSRMYKTVSLFYLPKTVYTIDGIVYNLQFLNLHYLMNVASAKLRTGAETAMFFAARPSATAGYINTQSFKRSLPNKSSFKALTYDLERTSSVAKLGSDLPMNLHFFELPNYDNDKIIEKLTEYYKPVAEDIAQWGRYSMSIKHLQLRENWWHLSKRTG